MRKMRILSLAITLAVAFTGVPVFAASAPYVESDTTTSFTRTQGETYQVKFTVHGTHANPNIVAGDGTVLQTLNTVKSKDSNGNDVYYFKVKAIGNVGTTSAIYTTLPGQSATRHFVITVVKKYPEGMYKVGSDIPAGEYVMISNSKSIDFGYFQVAKDSSGTLDSIVANDNFENRSIITVSDGEYITVQYADIYAINDAPAISQTAGKISSGMYKVGKDLKAGEYKVHATDSSAYVEVSSDSSHLLTSIISNDNFSGDKYISVENGQYIKIQNAEISLS
ncbi:hypothetical protein EQM14_05505 [Caproiciproducens sp. NJN-50]|uniref:hypothetical protein n=1 Tax=Acutalibacteraceae TaxID=3082771 RepID=UPI000FFE162E|nr:MULTISPECIES: hypothetical protein [Acutalibacteraceae]QAT49278.1 hypothetical protein EQM14_05505 [Caproiciproducens sp. NJN-50]